MPGRRLRTPRRGNPFSSPTWSRSRRRTAGRAARSRSPATARHHLPVARRLHGAAHQAERRHWLAALRDESENDGLERAPAGADAVRVPVGQHEARAAILQADARPGHHDAGAEVTEGPGSGAYRKRQRGRVPWPASAGPGYSVRGAAIAPWRRGMAAFIAGCRGACDDDPYALKGFRA